MWSKKLFILLTIYFILFMASEFRLDESKTIHVLLSTNTDIGNNGHKHEHLHSPGRQNEKRRQTLKDTKTNKHTDTDTLKLTDRGLLLFVLFKKQTIQIQLK